VEALEVRVCEATSDRKLKVVGSAFITGEMLSLEGLFEGDVDLEQNVEGERICVGICNVTVRRKT
jgi:hypothetical protein